MDLGEGFDFSNIVWLLLSVFNLSIFKVIFEPFSISRNSQEKLGWSLLVVFCFSKQTGVHQKRSKTKQNKKKKQPNSSELKIFES